MRYAGHVALMEEMRNAYLKGRDHSGYLFVDGRIILK
jgi:hypothetical protein